ncbi:hypothetical protein [Sinomicrobium sp. M5D2P9]
MKKLKVFICIVLNLGLVKCKSQSINHSDPDKTYFSIETDSLHCGDNNFVFVTQYIKFIHPDSGVKTQANKSLHNLLTDIYDEDEGENIKELNRKCCAKPDLCDFNIQEYRISFQNNNVASICFRNYMYGFTPGDFNQSINFDLKTGEILEINDIFSKEGISYIVEDTNRAIESAIREEKKTMTENELVDVEDIFNNYTMDKESIRNFILLKEDGQLYIKFLFSFNGADFQNQLLPVIDLKYNLKKLNSYLKEGFW